MADPKGSKGSPFGSGFPSIPVGNRVMFPDSQGGLHSTPGGAISENMRVEVDQSRGTSGGCGQSPANVPGGSSKK